jgi:CubicO group peptidase (beta-lactamase class C family)
MTIDDCFALWNSWPEAKDFSGVFSVRGPEGPVFEKCQGFRNRGEELLNNSGTAFAIASGTKLFTGLAVCKLIDENKLSLDDKICGIIPEDLGLIDKNVNIFHLLTHTSGIGDYIDEEAEDSVGKLLALYREYPVYLWERLKYYLKMITPLPQKFRPGERYSYCNAGYVLLGLAVEAVSGLPYQEYVENEIVKPMGLEHTGFYRTDALPGNTAHGYTPDEESGQLRANIFKVPVRGGSDGGIYTCAKDMDRLWRGLFSYKILSEEMTAELLKPQAKRTDVKSYGFGVYRYEKGDNLIYYALGGDFGVDFFSAYIPAERISVSALGNSGADSYPLLDSVMKFYDTKYCGS